MGSRVGVQGEYLSGDSGVLDQTHFRGVGRNREVGGSVDQKFDDLLEVARSDTAGRIEDKDDIGIAETA